METPHEINRPITKILWRKARQINLRLGAQAKSPGEQLGSLFKRPPMPMTLALGNVFHDVADMVQFNLSIIC